MNPLAATHVLTDQQLAESLALVGDADGVELRLAVPDQQRQAVTEELGIDPLDAQLRQVFFFDTPSLDLDGAGIVVRARRIQHGLDDTAIRLTPVVPAALPSELRKTRGFVVEVDAVPDGSVCSASFTAELGTTEVREAATGRRPVHRLFTKAQRGFYAEHGPAGIELDDLEVLGPVHALKLKFSPPELRQGMAMEAWLYPDGSRILELSVKCPPDVAFDVAAEARAYLAQRGIDASRAHPAKTRAALEFFSAQLRGA